MIYLVSDTHFSHKGILHLQPRPGFESVEDMNEFLIERWNDTISKQDEVYFLGDFGLGRRAELKDIFDRLNGIKHLIIGNHDEQNRVHKFGCASIHQYLELKNPLGYEDLRIILMHYPLGSWNKQAKGSIHFHGHSHGNYPDKGRMMDVGVDCLDGYRPILLKDTIEKMLKVEVYAEDHHHPDRYKKELIWSRGLETL